MENLLFLGVPILKQIVVCFEDIFQNVQCMYCIFSTKDATCSELGKEGYMHYPFLWL